MVSSLNRNLSGGSNAPDENAPLIEAPRPLAKNTNRSDRNSGWRRAYVGNVGRKIFVKTNLSCIGD